MTASTKSKKFAIKVVVSMIVPVNGEDVRLDKFQFTTREVSHDAGLRRRLQSHKIENMEMVDPNTVVVGLKNGAKKVVSVLRYSSQCPDCGSLPGKANVWCETCSAAEFGEKGFDPKTALEALLGQEIEEEETVEEDEE